MYTGQMQESMARFKQGGRAEYGKVYGRLLWDAKREWLQRIREPVLVPVPVHSKRYRKRGYNQAEEISAMLEETDAFAKTEIVRDYGGNNRVVCALLK